MKDIESFRPDSPVYCSQITSTKYVLTTHLYMYVSILTCTCEYALDVLGMECSNIVNSDATVESNSVAMNHE